MIQKETIVLGDTTESFAERALRGKLSYSNSLFRGVVQAIFPPTHDLLPQINQIYELDLAYAEYQSLSAEDIIRRGAYFRSINGLQTYHYRICMNTPGQVNASARQDRKNFFIANVFAVGYATHGLFPYRGKFHPQMIKAVMNIMGLKPGSTVLDPMAGCGTTSIEASIMGINSVSCELSPFACLMARAKVGALNADCGMFPELVKHADLIYQRFAPYEQQWATQQALFAAVDGFREEHSIALAAMFPKLAQPMRDLLLLCYLDAVGYAARRRGKTPRDLFPDLLSRYLAAVQAFNEIREEMGLTLGVAEVVHGDARRLQLSDASVDGVLFSPPYSFAIDYVENDRPQLQFLGVDVETLKQRMVGLIGNGRTKEQLIASKVANYFVDMETIMTECRRILRPGGYCVIIVGSNTNQTGGVSLEDGIINIGTKLRMPLNFQIMREIEGIRNTMRDEFLLFFRKPLSEESH
jgi:ubiquinone/menaquinone biosynthesis C-methylase UbiE